MIDPGTDAAAVLDAVGDREILAVICTHGHAGARRARPSRSPSGTNRRSRCTPRDRMAWREVHADEDPDIDMEDGGSFEVAGVTLEVLHAPGHSRGSFCLYSEELDAVFTGDVVTETGPVPHDGRLPGLRRASSAPSARQILTLPGGTRILPGHGGGVHRGAAEKSFDTLGRGRGRTGRCSAAGG